METAKLDGQYPEAVQVVQAVSWEMRCFATPVRSFFKHHIRPAMPVGRKSELGCGRTGKMQRVHDGIAVVQRQHSVREPQRRGQQTFQIDRVPRTEP